MQKFLRATAGYCFHSFGVLCQFRDLLETAAQTVEQLLVKRRLGRRQSIVAPMACFSHQNQPRSAQISEVAGCLGLWHAEHVDDVAHAELAVAQHMQNAQPRPVGECPKHHINAIGRLGCHIRLSKYKGAPSFGQSCAAEPAKQLGNFRASGLARMDRGANARQLCGNRGGLRASRILLRSRFDEIPSSVEADVVWAGGFLTNKSRNMVRQLVPY